MSSPLRVSLVEAFTAQPLGGNGAAVVLLEEPAAAGWMQQLAASLKQSETAFLWRNAAGQWLLRWFTPSCEVALCGHATLAATLALGRWSVLSQGQSLHLGSRSGPLRVALKDDHPGAASIELPTEPLQPLPTPHALASVLGAAIEGYWGSELGYRVVLLDDQVNLQKLPNPAEALQGADRQGLVVMQAFPPEHQRSVLGERCDYQLRFFAPGLGLPEDPVTGSAHALVAPWWAERLGRNSIRGWQPSARSGGMLCEVLTPNAVRLTGTGHCLWDGTLNAGSSGSDPSGWEVCRVA